MAKQNRKRK